MINGGFDKLLQEALDPQKVTLTCGIHGYAYGSKRSHPNFKCKQCNMVSFMGLLANTPPEKRQETVEMLEYTIHKLVEADKRGELDRATILKHPIVTITSEDGTERVYDPNKVEH